MNTTETTPRVLRVEAVDDLPILWESLRRIDFISLADKHFPPPLHWKGPLSTGEVLAVWLLYILSQGDHRLSRVEPWIARHQGVLRGLLGKTVVPTAAHDDRLADLLDRLSDSELFHQLEAELNRQTLRVYRLPTKLIRIDTTTANSYCEPSAVGGLLQFGHSKDNPDLPQLKVALAILDPLGMPLTTSVVAGNNADDPLYIPAIAEARTALNNRGHTYVGDCKMAALATRAFVAAGEDFYLCPLSEKQLDNTARTKLLAGLWSDERVLQSLYRPGKAEGDKPELLAEGFAVEEPLRAEVEGKEVSWVERRWLVRSEAYRATQVQALTRRLCKAERELGELPTRKQGKKRQGEAEMRASALEILKRERVTGLLCCEVRAVSTTATTRKYGKEEAREELQVSYQVSVSRQNEAIAEEERELGWQVYATDGVGLGMSEVVDAYRGQYRIENDWSRLKGKPLGLTPLYLQDEKRIEGLVYLLSVALRVLTLMEWVVREKLQPRGKKIKDVYPGQPGRQTMTPSCELLLQVFEGITISMIEVNGKRYALLSPLTEIQRQLLDLWDFPPDLYERILPGFPETPLNTSEP